MKKTFRLLALAAVSMIVAVACNNAPEATEDTTPVIDTIAEEPVAETPAKKTAKKPAKKQEVKKTNASEQNVNNAGGKSGTISAVNTNTKKSDGNNASNMNVNNAGNGAGTLSLKKN